MVTLNLLLITLTQQNFQVPIEVDGRRFQWREISDLTEDEHQIMMTAITRIKSKIDDWIASFGDHGAVNCGTGYSQYNQIHTKVRKRWSAEKLEEREEQMDPERLLLISRAARFIVMPLYCLPTSADAAENDNSMGERTWSKVLLNRLIRETAGRANYAEGFLTQMEIQHSRPTHMQDLLLRQKKLFMMLWCIKCAWDAQFA
ncbi:hypothetical protein PROFUN_16512 [Planoprotostelium fungivorum]|uniref:Uncharacterized protein n=1 Tax=Planoprotostelium fungivorum TaxID=1890364 RepID=A0A2P6MQD5_9EUKA|nr:hypothetical protein PROFUN_16512 [Planoprotostelium fungivorum]